MTHTKKTDAFARIAKIALGFTAAAALAACGRVSENETAVVMKRGAINEVVTKPELVCMPMCLPWTDIIRYKTFADTFTISSGQGTSGSGEQGQEVAQTRQMFLRSQDNKFIESISFSVVYEVRKVPAVTKLLTEFRANSTDTDENARLIRDDLQVLATQPMVQVVREYQALALQDSGAEIGGKLSRLLQQAVDARLGVDPKDSPLEIKNVILGGVKFDPATEDLLKQGIFAREQAEIAKISGEAAVEQAKAAAAQAGVTAEIVGRISGALPPSGQGNVASLVCLDLKRQKQIPENTQCFGMGMK